MKVIVLQGVSGSGKSTYGRKLAEQTERTGNQVAKIVSADFFFEKSGEYKFDFSKLGEAHGECFRNCIAYLKGGVDLVIVDNTNTTAVEMAPYMAAAQAYGYEAEVHQIQCDPKVAAARNLHGVPEKGVEGMAQRIANEKLPPWWKVVKV